MGEKLKYAEKMFLISPRDMKRYGVAIRKDTALKPSSIDPADQEMIKYADTYFRKNSEKNFEESRDWDYLGNKIKPLLGSVNPPYVSHPSNPLNSNAAESMLKLIPDVEIKNDEVYIQKKNIGSLSSIIDEIVKLDLKTPFEIHSFLFSAKKSLRDSELTGKDVPRVTDKQEPAESQAFDVRRQQLTELIKHRLERQKTEREQRDLLALKDNDVSLLFPPKAPPVPSAETSVLKAPVLEAAEARKSEPVLVDLTSKTPDPFVSLAPSNPFALGSEIAYEPLANLPAVPSPAKTRSRTKTSELTGPIVTKKKKPPTKKKVTKKNEFKAPTDSEESLNDDDSEDTEGKKGSGLKWVGL